MQLDSREMPKANELTEENIAESNVAQDAVNSGDAPPLPNVKGWRRVLYLALGATCFVIGALGAILPVLPTTPFLLLTSYFLLRSSPRLNNALLRSKFFGPILQDWQQRRVVRRDVKIRAIAIVLVAVGITIYTSGASFWPSVLVTTLAGIGLIVIVRLPELSQ